MTDITVPALGESVSEATIARWLKQVGDRVNQDEPLVELETDKVTLEVNATASGQLAEIKAQEGDTVSVGDAIGVIGEAGAATAATPPQSPQDSQPSPSPQQASPPPPSPQAPPSQPSAQVGAPSAAQSASDVRLSPTARKLVSEQNINPAHVQASGKHNTITKGDVLSFASQQQSQTQSPSAPIETKPVVAPAGNRSEERVRMTRLRQRIAQRLMESQKSTATLTTFNEIDMSNVMAIRNQLKEKFEKKKGIRLGFMSFFVKAAIVALKEIPAVNAEIQGDEIVYKNYYDIGVAVGTPQGLVVPVIRDADVKSFSEVEQDLAEKAMKAREGKLTMEEMMGGTFTVSNGGVYGSLMSTPILNPPQSGILGMHKVEKRPVVINDKIEIRPMMYVALSYDHRIIDGTESVTFLKRIKECIEDPERILLEI